MTAAVVPFSGTVWRALRSRADPVARAGAAEGRFHHAGQVAIYTSLTPEGTAIAIRRYLQPGDLPRVVVPLDIRAGRIVDLRGRPDVSIVWQDIRAGGAASPTWAFSDDARALGAEGLLYFSRSRPDLTHLVIFDPSVIAAVGTPRPFHPPG